MTWNSFLKSRLATILLGTALVFVMITAAKTLIQKHRIDKEIRNLQDQVERIKKNNEQLTYLIKYFDTPEYQEKQAREKLNLRKDGEYVVVLPENNQGEVAGSSQGGHESNFKLWFNYFFSKK